MPAPIRAPKKERDLIQKKIRSAENHISAAERKRRTRRLILMGRYMEHITANDEAAKDRLMKGLDGFLEPGSGPEIVRPAPNQKARPETHLTAPDLMNIPRRPGLNLSSVMQNPCPPRPDFASLSAR